METILCTMSVQQKPFLKPVGVSARVFFCHVNSKSLLLSEQLIISLSIKMLSLVEYTWSISEKKFSTTLMAFVMSCGSE